MARRSTTGSRSAVHGRPTGATRTSSRRASPYLADRPAVVPIDVGRQLFVDDFLIEDTSLRRTFHKAKYHAANPILKPEGNWETYDDVSARTQPAVQPDGDGVQRRRVLRSERSHVQAVVHGRLRFEYVPGALARRHHVGETGLRRRCKGTNIVHKHPRDSSTVWLDQFATDSRAAFQDGVLARSRAAARGRRPMAFTGPRSARPVDPAIARRSSTTRSGACGASACAPINSHRSRKAAATVVIGKPPTSLPRSTGRADRRWPG